MFITLVFLSRTLVIEGDVREQGGGSGRGGERGGGFGDDGGSGSRRIRHVVGRLDGLQAAHLPHVAAETDPITLDEIVNSWPYLSSIVLALSLHLPRGCPPRRAEGRGN